MKRFTRPDPDESGASLVIALIFVIAIALIITALIDLTGTNLATTANLQNNRSTEYAADGVVDGAIQMVRTEAATCSNSAPVFAPSAGINGFDLVAFCGNVGTPNGERIITFEACSSSNTTFASCAANTLLEAEVTFIDQQCSFVAGVPSCSAKTGYAVTTDTWTIKHANSA